MLFVLGGLAGTSPGGSLCMITGHQYWLIRHATHTKYLKEAIPDNLQNIIYLHLNSKENHLFVFLIKVLVIKVLVITGKGIKVLAIKLLVFKLL